jgi:hypothetical protein
MHRSPAFISGALTLVITTTPAFGQTAGEQQLLKEHLASTIVLGVERPDGQAFRTVLNGALYFVGAGWTNASGAVSEWSYSGKILLRDDDIVPLPDSIEHAESFDLARHLKPDFRLAKPADAKALLDVLSSLAADVEIPAGRGFVKRGNTWQIVLSRTDLGSEGFVVTTDAEGAVKSIRPNDSGRTPPRIQPALDVQGPALKRIRDHLISRIESKLKPLDLGIASDIVSVKVFKFSVKFKSPGEFLDLGGQETPIILQNGAVHLIEDIQNVQNSKDMAGLTKLVSPAFKLKSETDARKFEHLLDVLYAAGQFDNEEGGKAIRREGDSWVFVCGKFFKDDRGFVVNTGADGAITRIVYHLNLSRK